MDRTRGSSRPGRRTTLASATLRAHWRGRAHLGMTGGGPSAGQPGARRSAYSTSPRGRDRRIRCHASGDRPGGHATTSLHARPERGHVPPTDRRPRLARSLRGRTVVRGSAITVAWVRRWIGPAATSPGSVVLRVRQALASSLPGIVAGVPGDSSGCYAPRCRPPTRCGSNTPSGSIPGAAGDSTAGASDGHGRGTPVSQPSAVTTAGGPATRAA
jgi:hypothetical protein